ncbi:thermonuclease family protein [Cereibacter sphaeroides]|uniref:thermonuclease family protein n=1 Tax=Cereibacter sphaeroides TaxID=1063 RepID=UPI0018D5559D
MSRGINLDAWMVRSGWAVAYRRYGSAYVRDEDLARREKRGIWASRFEMPWDWRKGKR